MGGALRRGAVLVAALLLVGCDDGGGDADAQVRPGEGDCDLVYDPARPEAWCLRDQSVQLECSERYGWSLEFNSAEAFRGPPPECLDDVLSQGVNFWMALPIVGPGRHAVARGGLWDDGHTVPLSEGEAVLTLIEPDMHQIDRDDESAAVWVRGSFDVTLRSGVRVAGPIAASACAPENLCVEAQAVPVLPGGTFEAGGGE